MKEVNIFLSLLKTLIVGAVLTSTHHLCFGAKIRKKVYPCKPQFYNIIVGCKGVFVEGTKVLLKVKFEGVQINTGV